MNPFAKISSFAVSGMRAQSQRMQVVSENIANADTHGYRRKMVSFDNVYNRIDGVNKVEISRQFLDPTPGEKMFEPTHPLADQEGYVEMSNVSIMTEFADAREANRSYEAGLQIFQQAREMYSSLLDVLRR